MEIKTLGNELSQTISRIKDAKTTSQSIKVTEEPADKWKALPIHQKMTYIKGFFAALIRKPIKETEQLKNAFNTIEEWLSGKMNPKNWLLILGQVGLGKSKLATAICTAYNRVNYSPYSFENTRKWRMYSALQCVSAMKIESETNEYSRLLKCSKLFIDDIGTEPDYQMVFGNKRNCIQEILYSRYDRNLPTIITSNLTIEQLEKQYGLRVLDRLKEKSVLISLVGESLR